jgi:transposase
LGAQAFLKETAEAFHTSWDQVCDAVEYVVGWGLEHRTLESIRALGVDEIQYAKGHKYLTLVYQIDSGLTRLLWVGKERTLESFQGFFAVIGEQLAAQIEFVCSDMWQPYLDVIHQKCSQALHILDRFHIVAKMNKALDEVRAAESRKMAQEGHPPLLKKSRWCVLKRKQNLTPQQKFRLRDCSATTSRPSAPISSKKIFSSFGNTPRPPGPACSWISGAIKPYDPVSSR